MLVENINFTQAQLNATSGTVKTITDIDLAINTYNDKHYRPFAIRVNNLSGAAINFALFTDFEYSAYLLDNTISNLMPLANNTKEELNNPLGEITTIFCSGTVASHTSGVTFVVIKE